jgi:dTDP-4-amino-4,6-dideoxygalactose transaminase
MVIAHARAVHYSTPIITPEMQAAVVEALLTADPYILSERTKAFERDFAALVGAEHGVAVSSGTAALHLALLGAGIGAGDEVIVPANAYPPVADCVRLIGATPVLVDVDERTGCLEPALVAPALTSHTRAIVPLHMYGHPADLDPMLSLAHEHGLLLIEDGAHALGSRYKGRPTGALGDIGIFSTGRKHITTGGIGGMVTTNDADVAERVRLLRNHGRSERQQQDLRVMDSVEMLGFNYRQSEILATLGQLQLQHLPAWNEERRAHAAIYRTRLADARLPVRPLEEMPWAFHSYLHFAIRAERRDDLAEFLTRNGVETHFIYPVPVHRQRLHAGHVRVPTQGLPVSERITAEILTLPTRPGLAAEDIDYVCEQIEAFYRGGEHARN